MESGTDAPHLLGRLLRSEQDRILDRWVDRARTLDKPAMLDTPGLLDSGPQILQALAHYVDMHERGVHEPMSSKVAEAHADARLSQGYDLRTLISEYAFLRDTILEVCAGARFQDPDGIRHLHLGLDTMMAATAEAFSRARQRTLEALARVGEVVTETAGLDEFLSRLLGVVMETNPAVDSLYLLLVEGDRLRIRAAVGPSPESWRGKGVRIGEGFSGRIAAERKARFTRNASADPEVILEPVKKGNVRALYGLPLVSADRVIGVALMGSITAYEFSEHDQRLFGEVAARATAAIVQHQLRDALQEERETFVNIVAHDLKTPLQTVKGMCSLGLSRTKVTGDRIAGERFRKIDAQVDRMVALLDDLLDVRLLASGQLPVRAAEIPYCPLLHELAEEWQATTTAHRIKIEACSADISVWADRTRVAQVVGNLLGNAIKYSPHGGDIVVAVRMEGDDEVVTSITDHGIGIPPEKLTQIFERYSRAGGESGAKGHGIGLYVAAELVRAQGGTIRAESEVGRGATFSFTLPAMKKGATPGSAREVP